MGAMHAPLVLCSCLAVLIGSAVLSHAAGHCKIVSPFAAVTTEAYVEQSLHNISEWRAALMGRDHARHQAIHGTQLEKDAGKQLEWMRGLPMFQLYFGFATCPPPMTLTYFGPPREDPTVYSEGGKWACGPLPSENCVVYSLGSQNEYSFEESILRDTKCKVWTFDCTVDGHSVDKERHVFEKLCVGDPPPADSLKPGASVPEFARLEAIMKRLGHTHVTYLKIDIEGHEYDVMKHWREHHMHLPLQIAVEVHQFGHRYGTTDMYLRHMAGLGYAVVTKEDNVIGDCCAELLLVKVEQRDCGASHDDLSHMRPLHPHASLDKDAAAHAAEAKKALPAAGAGAAATATTPQSAAAALKAAGAAGAAASKQELAQAAAGGSGDPSKTFAEGVLAAGEESTDGAAGKETTDAAAASAEGDAVAPAAPRPMGKGFFEWLG